MSPASVSSPRDVLGTLRTHAAQAIPYLSTLSNARATHSPELISNLVPLQGIGGSRPQSAQVAGEDSIELETSRLDSLH